MFDRRSCNDGVVHEACSAIGTSAALVLATVATTEIVIASGVGGIYGSVGFNRDAETASVGHVVHDTDTSVSAAQPIFTDNNALVADPRTIRATSQVLPAVRRPATAWTLNI